MENKAGKGAFDPVTEGDRAGETAMRGLIRWGLLLAGWWLAGLQAGVVRHDFAHSQRFFVGRPEFGHVATHGRVEVDPALFHEFHHGMSRDPLAQGRCGEDGIPVDGVGVCGVVLGRDGAAGWPLRVEALEMLGAERLVYGRIGNEPFTLRIDGTMAPPKAGDVLRLAVAPQHVHWFDAQSGARV